MNAEERTKLMKDLSTHVGELVTVNYVDQMNDSRTLAGVLKNVKPYSNVEIAHLREVPAAIQHWDLFKGEKVFESITGIPFLGSPDAIMSISAFAGKVLYENEHVHPFYNPFFFPNTDEEGRLRIGVNHEAGEEYTEQLREKCFGRKK